MVQQYMESIFPLSLTPMSRLRNSLFPNAPPVDPSMDYTKRRPSHATFLIPVPFPTSLHNRDFLRDIHREHASTQIRALDYRIQYEIKFVMYVSGPGYLRSSTAATPMRTANPSERAGRR